MNKKIVVVSFVFLLLLASSAVGLAYAQTVTQAASGLSVGNTFTYSNTYYWTSTMAGLAPPYSLTAQNQSTLQVTAKTVTGSTVELEKIWAYRNGTQVTSTEYDEVNSGLTGTVLAYAGNLTAGGLLFPGSTDLPFTINDTQYRAYAGSNARLTNHINVNNTGIEGMEYSLMDLYFDQQTGMCVEYTLTSVYTSSPNEVVTQHLVLTSSNVWQVSNASVSPTLTPNASSEPSSNPTGTPGGNSTDGGFPVDLFIIVIVVVVVIIVAAGLLLPKGKKKSKQQSQEQPQEAPSELEETPKQAPPEESPKGSKEEDSYSI